MDRSLVLTLLAVLVTSLSHAFSSKTFPKGWSIQDSWRAVILSGLGLTAGAIDMIMNGAAVGKAVTTVLATSGGGLIVILLEALGGGDGGGSAAGGGVSSLPRPSKVPEVAIISIFVASVLAMGLLGEACQYAKPACDVVKVADQACDLLMVELPDGGGAEPVPKAEIQQLALRRKTLRLQLSPTDGGYTP